MTQDFEDPIRTETIEHIASQILEVVAILWQLDEIGKIELVRWPYAIRFSFGGQVRTTPIFPTKHQSVMPKNDLVPSDTHKLIDDFYRVIQRNAKITNEHLERMAAAYFLQTDIPPDEVQLIREQNGSEIRWYFRRRNEGVLGSTI